jgi:hypothetical protein
MSNALINISKVLADKSASTNLTTNHTMRGEIEKSLNYEIAYKVLEGEVEKLILLNKGNPTIDKFHKDVMVKLGYIASKLIPTD